MRGGVCGSFVEQEPACTRGRSRGRVRTSCAEAKVGCCPHGAKGLPARVPASCDPPTPLPLALLRVQVTNPAIDPIREKFVTSPRCMVGPEGDISGERRPAATPCMPGWRRLAWAGGRMDPGVQARAAGQLCAQ